MDFADYARLIDGRYSALLESGGEDRVALTQAIEAAFQTLNNLSPVLAAKLTIGQEQARRNLVGIYHHLAQDAGWRLADQRGWLEDARVLLLALQR